MNKKTVSQLVVLAIVAAGALIAWRHYGNLLPTLQREHRAMAALEHAAQSPRPGRYTRPDAQAADVWPRKDTLDIKADETLRSFWFDNERKRFSAILKLHPCDTLVVPVESQRFGFDRVTRSLMTAELAWMLAADPKRCVVDPYLAARALGEGMRRYERGAVEALARDVGAKTIVWTYAGHDDHMKMDLFVTTATAHPAEKSDYVVYKDAASRSWPAIAFTDETPPFVVWRAMLPDVLKAVDLGGPAPEVPPPAPVASGLPDAPEQFVATRSLGAVDDTHRYELLATLAPTLESRGTERLFEKAWLAAARAGDTPETRRTQARALLHLGYRPAALPLLKDDSTTEARLLAALLNGNLPEATKAAADLKDARQQLMATLEVHDLALDYGRDDAPKLAPIVADRIARSNGWAALLGARAGDGDGWKDADNGDIKRLLDALYPIDGYTYEEILRGNATLLQDTKFAELALLPIRHIDRLLDERADRFYHPGFTLAPQESDLLDLLAARATASLEKQVMHQLVQQGRPDHALTLLDGFDAEFLGHPHFLALRATAEVKILTTRHDESTAQRTARAMSAARAAAFWEQGNTITTLTALTASGIPSPTSSPFIAAYGNDFPPRPYWHWVGDVQSSVMTYEMHALNYSTTDPSPLGWLVQSPTPTSRKTALAELDTRFHGSREAADMRYKLDAPSGNEDIAAIRAHIAEDPKRWDWTRKLIDKLIASGDYNGALAAAKAYPGFKPDSGENTVGLSNDAYEAASQLYWRGAVDQAKPLFALSASYETGSEGEMLSSERIALLGEDYPGAARAALQRLMRYENGYSARDYLAFLFAFGDAKEAWPAFNQSAERFDNAELWSAALMGNRIAGATTAQFSEWLASDAIRSIRHDGVQPALEAGMSWFLIDRAPYGDLASLLEKVEGPPRTFFDKNDAPGYVEVTLPSGGLQLFPRSEFRRKEREMPKTKTSVPSAYVLFANAYQALQRGDNAAAVTAFDHLAGFYSIESDMKGSIRAALPYFALAAAKSGDTLGLRAYLDALPADRQSFESHLAEAYFAGLGADHDGAERELHRALGALDPNHFDTYRLAYQYAETCIRLFEETHEARYRDLALAYAKSFQRVDPTMAWAYALEARYGKATDAGHVRAIALAEYLDRDSAWLAGVPNADRERARAWLKRNNPFKPNAAAPHNAI